MTIDEIKNVDPGTCNVHGHLVGLSFASVRSSEDIDFLRQTGGEGGDIVALLNCRIGYTIHIEK